jgi:hypothetical protein
MSKFKPDEATYDFPTVSILVQSFYMHNKSKFRKRLSIKIIIFSFSLYNIVSKSHMSQNRIPTSSCFNAKFKFPSFYL